MLEIKDINLKFGDSLGEEDYIEPLTILLDSLKKEANLNLYGRLGVKYQIKHQLRMRSSLYAYSKKNISVDPKETLFVTGLPRSGTTFLFHLLLSLIHI